MAYYDDEYDYTSETFLDRQDDESVASLNFESDTFDDDYYDKEERDYADSMLYDNVGSSPVSKSDVGTAQRNVSSLQDGLYKDPYNMEEVENEIQEIMDEYQQNGYYLDQAGNLFGKRAVLELIQLKRYNAWRLNDEAMRRAGYSWEDRPAFRAFGLAAFFKKLMRGIKILLIPSYRKAWHSAKIDVSAAQTMSNNKDSSKPNIEKIRESLYRDEEKAQKLDPQGLDVNHSLSETIDRETFETTRTALLKELTDAGAFDNPMEEATCEILRSNLAWLRVLDASEFTEKICRTAFQEIEKNLGKDTPNLSMEQKRDALVDAILDEPMLCNGLYLLEGVLDEKSIAKLLVKLDGIPLTKKTIPAAWIAENPRSFAKALYSELNHADLNEHLSLQKRALFLANCGENPYKAVADIVATDITIAKMEQVFSWNEYARLDMLTEKFINEGMISWPNKLMEDYLEKKEPGILKEFHPTHFSADYVIANSDQPMQCAINLTLSGAIDVSKPNEPLTSFFEKLDAALTDDSVAKDGYTQYAEAMVDAYQNGFLSKKALQHIGDRMQELGDIGISASNLIGDQLIDREMNPVMEETSADRIISGKDAEVSTPVEIPQTAGSEEVFALFDRNQLKENAANEYAEADARENDRDIEKNTQNESSENRSNLDYPPLGKKAVYVYLAFGEEPQVTNDVNELLEKSVPLENVKVVSNKHTQISKAKFELSQAVEHRREVPYTSLDDTFRQIAEKSTDSSDLDPFVIFNKVPVANEIEL